MSDNTGDGQPNRPRDPRYKEDEPGLPHPAPAPPQNPGASGPPQVPAPPSRPQAQPPLTPPPAASPPVTPAPIIPAVTPPPVSQPLAAPAPAIPPAAPPQSQIPPAAVPPQYASPAQPVSGHPQPAKKKSRVGVGIAGGLLAAAVAGGGYVALSGDDSEVVTATDPVVTTVAPTQETTTAPPTTESGAETSTTTDQALPATVAELARSTVQVVLLSNGQPSCLGSGTFIDNSGSILTNAHVVEPSDGCRYDTIGIAVTDNAGLPPELLYTAGIYAYDPLLDLAVVRIEGGIDGAAVPEDFPGVPVGDSDQVEIGDELRILGYPGIGGDTITFTNGVVSGFTSQAEVGDRSWIKTDATIAGGNSGGAAFDTAGQLIGIPTQASASNSSPVVDCRSITDTNGDGEINSADQCVPIGGFLNGIRPVNLAVPLILDARSSERIELDQTQVFVDGAPADFDTTATFFSNPGWTIDASEEEGFVPDFVPTVAQGTDSLCIWFDWKGMADGVVWDGIWLVDGEINEIYSLFGASWALGPEGVDNWVCALDPDGLSAGIYEFAFLVGEDVKFVESIRVTAEPVSVYQVDFVNRTGAEICYFYVAPFGASDTGLDELGLQDTMADGDTVTLPVPEGEVIVDAYNCAFEPIFANYDGIIIDGDGFYELAN